MGRVVAVGMLEVAMTAEGRTWSSTLAQVYMSAGRE